jgi:hypothetical protein
MGFDLSEFGLDQEEQPEEVVAERAKAAKSAGTTSLKVFIIVSLKIAHQ